MGTFFTKNIHTQQQQYVSLLYGYNLIMRYDIYVRVCVSQQTCSKIHIVIKYIIRITLNNNKTYYIILFIDT